MKKIILISLSILNVLLIAVMIAGSVLKAGSVGIDNMLYISAIPYFIFTVMQLIALFAVKEAGKYLGIGLLTLLKAFSMIWAEIIFDIAQKHASDYVRNASDSVVIVCFFILVAILLIVEIVYCSVNYISRRRKDKATVNFFNAEIL